MTMVAVTIAELITTKMTKAAVKTTEQQMAAATAEAMMMAAVMRVVQEQ